MASDNQREFLVLYTHQKTKKSKRWQDGILKVSHQTSRAVLFDDRGCKLDAVYVKPKQVAVGEELESERYLITIEEEKQSGCASEEKDGSEGAQRSQHQQQQHQQQQHQQQQLPKTDFQNRMRIPLKRKRTGFTVPRQVVKKLATANDDVQSGLPSSISHQMKTGMETAPHFGRRAPLFSTPFSKEMEGLSDSMDCAGAVLGSQETKHDRPSMSLNDQSQSYMYQTKENHSCTLPPTMEDSSPPPCYNVDTPKGDRLGHAVLGAPSFCNGLRTFAGLPNAIPDKENVLNLIPKHNIDEKIADLKEGIVIKEQLYRQDHFESQDCVFLSSRETSLPPVQESDQTHSTTAITKPSLPSVGKRSTSQILALLGKGNVKFKPPIKQLDSDWTLKVSETAPHACSADLKTLFHSPVTESPSVMPSEQVLSEDIDVMELLGRADLSTADSCIKPLPDQFDLDGVNSSRISHEVLGRCSHETVQGNETQTSLSHNLPKPSKLGETKESVVHVGSTEKLCEVEQDNGSSLQKILGKKNQGKNEDVQNFHEKPKIRNQQDKHDKSQEEINHHDAVVIVGHRNQGSRNQTRNQIDGMIVHLNKMNQDCGNQGDGNQTSNQTDGINVDKENQDCGNQGDGNQTSNQIDSINVDKENQDCGNQGDGNQTSNQIDSINVDKENQDCGNQDARNQIENQVDVMNDDGNQNQEEQSQNNGNRDKNQTYGDKVRKHVQDANSCSDEINQGCSKNQSDSSQDGSSHDSVVHHGDCNQGDRSQDSKNHGENNHLDDGNHGDEITHDYNDQGDENHGDSNSQDDGNHGDEITQECHNQGDGNHGNSNSQDDGNQGDEITQECHNQGDGNRGDSNSLDDGNHGDEITQECHNQGDGNRGDSNSLDDSNHDDEITHDCSNQGDENHGNSNCLDDGNQGDEITHDCSNQGDENHGDSNSRDDGNHGNSNQESNKQNTSHAVGDNRDSQDNCDVTHGTSSNQVNVGTHCSNCYNDSFQVGRILPENHRSELIIHKLRTDSETATHTAVAEITASKVACALCGVELSNTLQDMCSECNDELATGFESSWKSGNHSQENDQERQLRVSSQDATTEVSVMQNKVPDTGEAVRLSSSSSECCILVKHNGVSLSSKFENARASPKLNCSNQAPAEVIDGEYTVQKHVLSIENQDKRSFQTDPANINSSNGKGESSLHDDFALESASLLSTMLSTGYIPNQCGLRNFKSSGLQREVNKDLKIIQDPSQVPINTFEFPHHSEDKSIRMVDKDRTTLFQYPVEDWLKNVDSMSSAELGETRDCVVPQTTVTLPRTGCWDQEKQELVPKMDLLVMNRRENEDAPNYQLHVHHQSKVSHQLETATKDHQTWAESSSSSTEQCVPVDQDRSADGDLTVSQDEYVQHESPGRRDMHLVRGFFHSNVLKRMSEDTSGEILPVPEVQTRSHPLDVIPPFRSPNSKKWSQGISFFDPVKLRGVARRGRTEIVSHEMKTDDFNQGLTAKQIHRDGLDVHQGRIQDILTSVKSQGVPCRMSGPAVKNHSENIDLLTEDELQPIVRIETQNTGDEFCEANSQRSRRFSEIGHHFSRSNKSLFHSDAEGRWSGSLLESLQSDKAETLSPLMSNQNWCNDAEIAVNPWWLPVTPNKKRDSALRNWSASSSYSHSIHQETEVHVDENINEDHTGVSEMIDQVSSSQFGSGNPLDGWMIPRDHRMNDRYPQSSQPVLNTRNDEPVAGVRLWEQTTSYPGGHIRPYPSLPHPSQLKRGPSYDEDLSAEGCIARLSDKKLKKRKRENYWNDPVSSGTVRRRPPAPTLYQASARRQRFSVVSRDGGYSAPIHARPQVQSWPSGEDGAKDEQWREATDEYLPHWVTFSQDKESGISHSRSEMSLSSYTTEKETVDLFESDTILESTLYPSDTATNESIPFISSLTDETVASRQLHNRHHRSSDELLMEYIVHNESTIQSPFFLRQDDVPSSHHGITDLIPPYSSNWRQDDVQTQVRNILASPYKDSLNSSRSPSKGRQDNDQIQSELQNILLQSSLQNASGSDFSPSPCKWRRDKGHKQSSIHNTLSSSPQDAFGSDISPSLCKWRQDGGPTQSNMNSNLSSSPQDAYSPEICQSPSKWGRCKAQNQFSTPRIFSYAPQDANNSDFTQSLFELRREMSTPHQHEASFNQSLSIETGRDIFTGNNGRWLGHQGTIAPPSTPSNTYDYPECTAEGLSSQCLVRQQYKGFKNPTSPFAGQSSLSSGRSLSGELFFPSEGEVQGVASLKRQVKIPASFPSVASYKQVFTSALKEHLNLILFNLGQRFHTARNKVDTRHLDSSSPSASTVNPQASHAPHCDHGNAAKLVCVKKEGKNKGRFFYACSAPRSNQCKFFMWADQFKSDTSIDAKGSNTSKISLMEPNAAVTFFKGHNVRLYYGCEFRRRASSYNSMLPGAPAWVMKRKQHMMESTKKKLYLNLSRKESSTSYGKDDIWVISKDLTFDPRSTFLAKSAYHGPSSNNDVEIEPLACYSTSNWPSPCNVHAILACNASSELTCLSNLQEHVSAASVPILQSLINNSDTLPTTNPRLSRFKSPAQAQSQSKFLNCPPREVEHLATLMIETHKLNTDQAKALRKVARMFQQTASDDPNPEPVTLIHGVFGAGKSFLLAVTVLFLVQLFKLSEDQSPEAASQRSPWKLLIASTTNVAVDRILLGLLGLGFEDFIRVGSLRKIAKPVLPYSVHASDKKDSQEIRDLTEMLKTDLTPTEKSHVRRSLERQRLGQNRDLLGSVKVVGVTCAACTFPCMSKLVFPVILLDECSQMTEPSSMLPIARFQSEKLVLVGDPKQLDPTIQGSEAAHSFGLEQTLFNRLIHQGHEPILLRTQYRCHPRISAIANCLFYDQQLQDGVVAEDRPPLTPSLPTLCFFSVPSGKECCARDGSFYNAEEASFVVYLIEVLLSLGVEPGDVGVITLYKAQTVKINMTLQDSKLTNRKGIKAIQISTVDAFQGGEKGVIILSCVRTDYMGFADSDKRTNVALTRSKNHLFIVGNLRILLANNLWGQVINLCKDADNGIQTSKGFIREWAPKLEELQRLEEEAKSQKRGRRSKASQETELEELEKKTSCQKSGNVSKDPHGKTFRNKCLLETSKLELPQPPDTSSLRSESPSFSPFSEVEGPVPKGSKLEESQVGVSTLCNSGPSYSPLLESEESGEEDNFIKEPPPWFDIGGVEDILE